MGIFLAILSVKLIHKTSQELTDIISPELVKEVKKIVMETDGVVKTNAILMRRSGDTIFADVTISLRGDTSFEQAHNISSKVENNIKMKIPNAAITIHFEPNWENVPINAKIYEIVNDIDGVRGVHNVISHKTNGIIFANLHVMVDREMNLDAAHKISEIVEQKIQKKLPKIEHVTVHLEPFVMVPESFNIENKETEKQIRNILDDYVEVKEIGRIISLNFEDIQKIDIDCSFDKELSIEKVHDLTSEIEHVIRMKIKNAVITIHPEPI